MSKTLFAALFLSGAATTAMAHSTLEQTEAAIGATMKITLRVPHGCDGEATNAVRIDLPDGVYAAKPMPKAGWTLNTVTGAYTTPYDDHGTAMTEGVREIVWSGGALEDAWYDEFTLRATIGPNLAPGDTLYFPALQTCATSTADWTDTSGSHDVPNPAPSLRVVAATAAQDDHAMHMSALSGTAVTIGDLTITAPYARATLPNAPVAGGFLTVTNLGATDDRLVSVTSDVAGRVEIHEMAMDGDIMRMRALPDGLPIPAGQTVTLEPGGYHIMFMDMHHPLLEGETATVNLTFAGAGAVDVMLPIGAPNAAGSGHGAHDTPAMSQ